MKILGNPKNHTKTCVGVAIVPKTEIGSQKYRKLTTLTSRDALRQAKPMWDASQQQPDAGRRTETMQYCPSLVWEAEYIYYVECSCC